MTALGVSRADDPRTGQPSRYQQIVNDLRAPQGQLLPQGKGCGGPPPAKRKILPDSIPALAKTTCIDLDVTNGCNLACGYCFKNLDTPHNMSLETAKDSIEWLIRASGNAPRISVNFMGGEPTLRFPMLKKIVRWGKRRAKAAGKRMSFSLTSNMTLWNDELRKWVDEEGLGVLMSIDGIPEIQDMQRPSKDGKSKAAIIAKWCRSMLQTRRESQARLTIVGPWVHRLYDSCLYLWEEIGFKNIVVADADHEGWTEEHFSHYEEQWGNIVDYLSTDFERECGRTIKISTYYMERLIVPRDLGKPPVRRNHPCGAGYDYSMIDHEGTIWPCHRFDGAAQDSGLEGAMSLGNIYSSPYNKKLSNVFRSFDHPKMHKPACRACPVEPICGGFCPAANLSDTGDLYTPHDSFCRLKWIVYAASEELYRRFKAIDEDRAAALIANSEGVFAP